MTGGAWLAHERQEIEQAREGANNDDAPPKTDTSPTYSAPSRYPLCLVAGLPSVAELASLASEQRAHELEAVICERVKARVCAA